MLTNLKLAALIALAATLLFGWFRISHLATENDRLSTHVTALEQTNQSMATELAANREALAAREIERQRLSDETSELKFKLGELYESDKTASDWATADCPPGLLECLLP